jgi:hypothetical protein
MLWSVSLEVTRVFDGFNPSNLLLGSEVTELQTGVFHTKMFLLFVFWSVSLEVTRVFDGFNPSNLLLGSEVTELRTGVFHIFTVFFYFLHDVFHLTTVHLFVVIVYWVLCRMLAHLKVQKKLGKS